MSYNHFVSSAQVIAQMKRTCTRLNLLRAGTEMTSRATTTMATSLHHRDDESECPGGGANGSLLQHNGAGGREEGARGGEEGARGRGAAVNGTTAGSQGQGQGQQGADGRSHSYIPMKTLSAGSGAQSGGSYM